MEQTPPPPSSTPQPAELQPPPQPPPSTTTQSPSPSLPPPPPSSSLLPSTIPSSPNPNPSQKTPTPTPNPNPQPQQPQQQQPNSQNPQTRQPFNRPWQNPSHFPHFSAHLPHPPSSSSSSSPVPPFSSPASSSITAPPLQRGGMAVGVPAHHPSPPPPPTSLSSINPPSFGQQFGGLGRSSANVPEPITTSSSSQVRQPTQGIQGMGTMGSFGSGSQMRPGGMAAHHQQRSVQPSLRPPTTSTNQSPASQNFQGHSLLRGSSVGSLGSPSPNSTSQSLQSHNQPWLSSGSQGKPPLPSPPFRPQMNAQSLQQRSHIPQQHHHQLSTSSQQQQTTSSHQPLPPSTSHLPQEHFGQQFPPPRSITHQLQLARSPGLGNQKGSTHGLVQPSPVVQSAPPIRAASPERVETCNRILSKRSIQEIVTQIDPSEKLDPEVEDILVDIADEFVDSITTFGCSLAKHRKSNTLEAKDILLHLERNWNMSLPGFGGDEIKTYKKPFSSDIHRERLAVIKRSMVVAETANTKSSSGQGAGNAKGHLAKGPVNVLGSPTPKIREAA